MDLARRAAAVVVGAVCAVLLLLGTRAFASLVTDSFSSAGYAIVPLGIFIVTIFLLPLISTAHRLWTSGDPRRRADAVERKERDEARARLTISAHQRHVERLRDAGPRG